jgi:hypothetical protein
MAASCGFEHLKHELPLEIYFTGKMHTGLLRLHIYMYIIYIIYMISNVFINDFMLKFHILDILGYIKHIIRTNITYCFLYDYQI